MMGYFANGCEGDNYRCEYCFKCRNWERREGEDAEGCLIMDLHFAYNYQLCNSKSLAAKFLDRMIPRETVITQFEGKTIALPTNGRCRMFLSR